MTTITISKIQEIHPFINKLVKWKTQNMFPDFFDFFLTFSHSLYKISFLKPDDLIAN